MSKTGQTLLDEFTARALIALGASPVNEREEIATELKIKSAFLRSRSPDVAFTILQNLDWDEVCKMIKGLTIAEILGVSNYRGSVSLVKYAFQVAERRNPVESMALAGWIVDHSDNPYIPFEMRKIRYAFESIKRQVSSWQECREQLNQWELKERDRQNRLVRDAEIRREFAQNEKPAIRKAIRERCNAEKRNIQIAKSSARKQFLNELAKLPPDKRLEHIAWDDLHPLGYYPSEFANVETGILKKLSLPTVERLNHKLIGRRKGPWAKLFLGLTNID